MTHLTDQHVSALVDELEKIAVSPGWISKNLEGMAEKLRAAGGARAPGAIGLRDRLNSGMSSFKGKGPTRMPQHISARPTSPVFQRAHEQASKQWAKVQARTGGRDAIRTAISK